MNGSVLDLVRPDLRDLQGYVAAEPDFERLRLHANESPWDTSVELPCEALNRYPPVRALALEQRLADVYGIEAERLLVTRGSDDGIDLLVRTFCRAGEDAVLTTPPTFGMYAVAARIQNALHVEVPLISGEDFRLDVQAVLAACEASPVRLVFLCSPNNPTGQRLAPESVREICTALAGRAVVVVDEAYAEFTGASSHAADLDRHDNLIVLRTLSKAHGLAGVRCGAVLAAPSLITLLCGIAPPYSTPSPVISAVLARLTDEALAQTAERMVTTAQLRSRLSASLTPLRWVRHVWPSDANFVLVDVDEPDALVAWCREHDVLIRRFPGKPGLDQAVRISIGTPEQVERLISLLEAFT
jgi:histidinol-phosphate aminotransferase